MKYHTTHDHTACIDRTLGRAAQLASDRGLRLTPARKRALEILLENHSAIGAYELLDRLRAEGLGDRPVIAYRALEFLQENGLVHRIEGLNAYVACTHPDPAHRPAFVVCKTCRSVTEGDAQDSASNLEIAAQSSGMKLERTVVEAFGICQSCQQDEAAKC